MKKYKAKDQLYHSNPNAKIGENAIGKTMREIARACEFENWERFTNHAGRALDITMMLQAGGDDTLIARQSRHKGSNSMTSYKRNTKIMESDLQDNLMGSYLGARFETPSTKKPSSPKKKPPPEPSSPPKKPKTAAPQEPSSPPKKLQAESPQEPLSPPKKPKTASPQEPSSPPKKPSKFETPGKANLRKCLLDTARKQERQKQKRKTVKQELEQEKKKIKK
jgi:hypothetical protein